MWCLCGNAILLIVGVLCCVCAQSSHPELSLGQSHHLGYAKQPFAAAANVKREIQVHYLNIYLTIHMQPDFNFLMLTHRADCSNNTVVLTHK